MVNFYWYINRLRLMSLPEIAYRIKSWVLAKIELLPERGWPTRALLSGNKPLWYFDQKPACESSTDCADKLLAHRFSFFALKDVDLGPVLDWHRDYMRKKIAPVTRSSKLNYRDLEVVGDIKYVWELSRHLHLVTLAKVYYLTGHTEYKREVLAQINSWVDANPYLLGVHWTSSLESGIRLISWSWVWYFLGDIDTDFQAKWVKSIYQHCYFISQHFSKFSSANNHLIGEAAGLFIASLVWDFGRESREWKEKGFKTLIREIEKQTYSDGVNKEQAISYQQFVLDFLLLAALLGEKNGVKFPENYWKKIEKMMEYLASLMDVHGNVPHIGDEDDGFVVKLADGNDFSPYRSLLATGAVLFNRWDFKQKAGSFDEKSLWLLGEEGKKRFEALPKNGTGDLGSERYPVPFAKSFPEGGYYILSTKGCEKNEIKAVFDCGPLGYLSLAAHGHADALSFTLSVGGEEFLIDPGTYAYHSKKEWRNYFRGTQAHNTIAVDGQDQSVIGGNFMWLQKAQAKVLKFDDAQDEVVVIGEHGGYKRLKNRVIHQREIRLDKIRRQLVITDRLSGQGSYSIAQMFHFDSRVEVRQGSGGLIEAVRGAQKVTLQVDPRLQASLLKGSLEPLGGWQSCSFDVKEPCYTLRNLGGFSGPCELKTIIYIGGES